MTFSSFLDKFIKQHNIRKNSAILLVLYYLLVLLEVKDACLIDHMTFPSIERLEEMLFSIDTYCRRILGSDIHPKQVFIVLLGDDIFIVNDKRWREKAFAPLKLLNLNEATGCTLQQLSSVEEEAIRTKILSLFDSEASTIRGKRYIIRSVAEKNPVFQEIGAPFLAGFLLGYPYVYWASCVEERYEQSSNLLSYSTLRKTSLFLEVVKGEKKPQEENPLFADILSYLMLNRCNVSEFTVPESLVDEEVEGVIRDWIAARRARFEEVTRLLHLQDGCYIDSIIETIQTESISL